MGRYASEAAVFHLAGQLERAQPWFDRISQLKDRLSEYLNRVAYGRERIIVASRGKPKAAVISLADLERLEALECVQK